MERLEMPFGPAPDTSFLKYEYLSGFVFNFIESRPSPSCQLGILRQYSSWLSSSDVRVLLDHHKSGQHGRQ